MHFTPVSVMKCFSGGMAGMSFVIAALFVSNIYHRRCSGPKKKYIENGRSSNTSIQREKQDAQSLDP